jgi:hypothetical protein
MSRIRSGSPRRNAGTNYVDLITGIGNASAVVDETWIERSVPEVVLGISCRVLGAEELIASKIFVAYRERFDGADLVHLFRCRGNSLDWPRLLQLAGSHWELLFWSLVLFAYVYPAKTGIVPDQVWEELIGWFTARIQHPNKHAPFRGSLLDPRMFAIDVKEWGERDLYSEYCARHPGLLETENSSGSQQS